MRNRGGEICRLGRILFGGVKRSNRVSPVTSSGARASFLARKSHQASRYKSLINECINQAEPNNYQRIEAVNFLAY